MTVQASRLARVVSWSMLVLLAGATFVYAGGIAQTVDQGFAYVGAWLPLAVALSIMLLVGEVYLLRLARATSTGDLFPRRVALWVLVIVPTASRRGCCLPG